MDLGAMLNGKRVLITGASSGLGENFARLAAGCHAKVVIAARRKDRLQRLAKELEQAGSPQVTVIEMDAASEQSIDDAFAQIDASGEILDVVVNNAGVSNDGLALTLPTKDFDDLMAVNVRAVWLVSVRAAQRWQVPAGVAPSSTSPRSRASASCRASRPTPRPRPRWCT